MVGATIQKGLAFGREQSTFGAPVIDHLIAIGGDDTLGYAAKLNDLGVKIIATLVCNPNVSATRIKSLPGLRTLWLSDELERGGSTCRDGYCHLARKFVAHPQARTNNRRFPKCELFHKLSR